MYTMEEYSRAVERIRERCPSSLSPRLALVLGSGLGGLAAEVTESTSIPYAEIPGFARSTVASHAGELVCGRLFGVPVFVLSGRLHYYEGYSFAQTAFPVRVLSLLGVRTMLITNAAGGIDERFRPGDFMAITDHIKFTSESPARGELFEPFGERFFDMTSAYDPALLRLADRAADECGVDLKHGVYAFMAGPQFETPAEIRMLSLLGASAVGMSTVAEVIAAAQCGVRVLGLSCITNMAAGITGAAVTDAEVTEVASAAAARFRTLVQAILLLFKSEDAEEWGQKR